MKAYHHVCECMVFLVLLNFPFRIHQISRESDDTPKSFEITTVLYKFLATKLNVVLRTRYLAQNIVQISQLKLYGTILN